MHAKIVGFGRMAVSGLVSRRWQGRAILSLGSVFLLGSQLAAPGARTESVMGHGEPRQFDVRTFGAVGDGKAQDRDALQAAVDAAHAAGGGVVRVPSGVYLTGSLRLSSGVTLFLSAGATLLGSPVPADYSRIGPDYALLLAEGESDLGIAGEGTIDGQGRALAQAVMKQLQAGQIQNRSGRTDRPDEAHRPMLLAFRNCRQVRVSGVRFKDSACWVQNYADCEQVRLDHLRVESTAFWNNDGIDITDCGQVTVTHCVVNAADDGICLKSEAGGHGCRDVEIADCQLRSSASAFKLGTASHVGFRHIRVRNLTVWDTFRSAIALECVDGGVLEDVRVEGVRADNTGNAVFLRLGHRNESGPIGQLRNVVIRDLTVRVPARKPDAGYEIAGPADRERHNVLPCVIAGLPGHPISQVSLQQIRVRYPGAADGQWHPALAEIPERSPNYPEFSMFGELPAWGAFLRHVEGLRLDRVQLVVQQPDFRAVLAMQDVHDIAWDQLDLRSAGAPNRLVFDGVTGLSVDGRSLALRAGEKIPLGSGRWLVPFGGALP